MGASGGAGDGRLRILTIGNRYPPWSLGGYETIWQAAVAALRTRGHTVRVLTTGPDPTDEATATAAQPGVHRDLRWYWRAHEFPPIGLRATVALERANAQALRHHLADFRPDAIVWWAMGGMSLSLLEQVRRVGPPALGVVGDDWMVYGPAVDAWTRRWRGRRRAPAAALASVLAGVPAQVDLDAAARWAFISEHVRAGARATGLMLAESLVAHPGVDPARFAPAAPRPWRWRLAYIGRLDPRKGVDVAIRALAELPQATSLMIDGGGDDGYRERLRVLADELGVIERVSFVRSARDEVPRSYAAADAVVFPVTWEEPWGLVPLEAMSVGRPVIASRAGGGAAEYLREGENCITVPPGSPGELAQAVGRLAADSALREALVRGGRATAARLTADAFHERLHAELERLVVRGRRSYPL